jgi:hypothetical protein
MDPLDAMVLWEQGALPEDDTIRLFQRLVSTGLAWQLQGTYGRYAHQLLNAGLIH